MNQEITAIPAPGMPVEATTDDELGNPFRAPEDAETFRRALETAHDAIREPGYGTGYKGITISIYDTPANTLAHEGRENFGIVIALPNPPGALTAKDAMTLAGQLAGVAERLTGMETAARLRRQIELDKAMADKQTRVHTVRFQPASTSSSTNVQMYGLGSYSSNNANGLLGGGQTSAQNNSSQNNYGHMTASDAQIALQQQVYDKFMRATAGTSDMQEKQTILKTMGQILGVVK